MEKTKIICSIRTNQPEIVAYNENGEMVLVFSIWVFDPQEFSQETEQFKKYIITIIT